MKATATCTFALTLAVAGAASAQTISTDRFGYNGTITEYASVADAQSGMNPGTVINVTDRDLSLYNDADYAVAMGSWWYTTSENTNGLDKDDPAGNRYYSGHGNINGNTGVGFLQIYDDDSSAVVSESMSFGGFDGTYYTEFNYSVSGSALASEYARLSATHNVNDSGEYLEYSINLTATGLEGVYDAMTGMAEYTGEATGVTGTFSGIFVDSTAPASGSGQQPAVYAFSFDLAMDNWAFAQGNDALNGDFTDSYFQAAVPEPTSLGVLGIAGLALVRRRR